MRPFMSELEDLLHCVRPLPRSGFFPSSQAAQWLLDWMLEVTYSTKRPPLEIVPDTHGLQFASECGVSPKEPDDPTPSLRIIGFRTPAPPPALAPRAIGPHTRRR